MKKVSQLSGRSRPPRRTAKAKAATVKSPLPPVMPPPAAVQPVSQVQPIQPFPHTLQAPIPPAVATIAIYDDDSRQWLAVADTEQDFPISVKQTISPQWADDVLQNRNGVNRPLNRRRAEKIARDIVADHWKQHSNGIAFYADGTLADGQHRLLGVVIAGVPVTGFIFYGLEKGAGTVIDDVRPRSDRDIAALEGMQLSSSFVATANYLLMQIGQPMASRHEKLQFYSRHYDAIQFVVERLNRKYVSKAPICAALSRAWYTQDKEKLAKFIELLQTGMFSENKAEDGAYRLREFALENSARSDGHHRAALYSKAKSALVAFMQGVPMSKLYGISSEPFLLPEERIQKEQDTYENRSRAMREVAIRRREQQQQTVGAAPSSNGQ